MYVPQIKQHRTKNANEVELTCKFLQCGQTLGRCQNESVDMTKVKKDVNWNLDMASIQNY